MLLALAPGLLALLFVFVVEPLGLRQRLAQRRPPLLERRRGLLLLVLHAPPLEFEERALLAGAVLSHPLLPLPPAGIRARRDGRAQFACGVRTRAPGTDPASLHDPSMGSMDI